jgi:tRNA modification GTPase
LIDLRAEVEARLDFADEGDVGEGLPADFWSRVHTLRSQMEEAVRGAVSAERVREGFRVSILGLPNAGKSSLLNALAGRDVATVTSEVGTTRDVLEVPLDLNGYPVVLYDTAGLREATSMAEVEGVRRALRTADQADLILWLSESGRPSPPPADLPDIPLWIVSTKVDLAAGENADAAISVVSGAGFAELSEKLAKIARQSLGRGNALVTRRRQKDAVLGALDAVKGVIEPRHGAGAVDPLQGEEITADLLRSASDAIGRLTGRVGVEDVLDRLFREFCIGK